MERKGTWCDIGSEGIKKGPWSLEEDQKLITYVQNHGGPGNWQTLPKLAGINRSGKSCRLRWMNYLRPDIKRGFFTPQEEQIILNLHSLLGNKWATIAKQLPKFFWNTHLKKRLIEMGLDPMTHRLRIDISSIIKQVMEKNENPSWEEQALRLLQLQTLQYLQYYYLLQLPNYYPLTNINYNNINPNENEIMNLINSLPSPQNNDQDLMFSHCQTWK